MSDSEQLQLLIVDDDELNRDIIEEYLEESDFEITMAEDGDIALNILEEEPTRFDIILLDRMMPNMDGMEVLSRVKKHPILSSIPVIMQTARAGKQDIMDGMKAGAQYYLTKPFEEAMLKTVIKTAINDRQRYLNIQHALEQSTRTLGLLEHGRFLFQTLDHANDLSTLLAKACPDPGRVVTGLSELMVNAIEHGNLGIQYHEKTRLNEEGRWHEEIDRRLKLPENQNKFAELTFQRNEQNITITIKDQGSGFDWNKYLELDPERAFDNHGRGIAMAKMLSFDQLEYQGCGNEVTVTVS